MGDIFSNAEIVFSASSATSITDGFLKSRPQRRYVLLAWSDSIPSAIEQKDGLLISPEWTPNEPKLYLCGLVDNYETDVEQVALKARGWVLPELIFAKCTLSFTLTQVYWQCDDGIRCESLMKMTR